MLYITFTFFAVGYHHTRLGSGTRVTYPTLRLRYRLLRLPVGRYTPHDYTFRFTFTPLLIYGLLHSLYAFVHRCSDYCCLGWLVASCYRITAVPVPHTRAVTVAFLPFPVHRLRSLTRYIRGLPHTHRFWLVAGLPSATFTVTVVTTPHTLPLVGSLPIHVVTTVRLRVAVTRWLFTHTRFCYHGLYATFTLRLPHVAARCTTARYRCVRGSYARLPVTPVVLDAQLVAVPVVPLRLVTHALVRFVALRIYTTYIAVARTILRGLFGCTVLPVLPHLDYTLVLPARFMRFLPDYYWFTPPLSPHYIWLRLRTHARLRFVGSRLRFLHTFTGLFYTGWFLRSRGCIRLYAARLRYAPRVHVHRTPPFGWFGLVDYHFTHTHTRLPRLPRAVYWLPYRCICRSFTTPRYLVPFTTLPARPAYTHHGSRLHARSRLRLRLPPHRTLPHLPHLPLHGFCLVAAVLVPLLVYYAP